MDSNKPLDNLTSILQLAGSSAFVFYLIGYIGVNSYYVKNGFFSYDIFSVQIVSAGVLFSVIYGIYGFAVGRRLIYLNADREHFTEMGSGYRRPLLWRDFVNLFVIVELFFGIVVGVFWTSGMIFEVTNGFKTFSYVLIAAFIFDYAVLWQSGLYANKPYIALPLAFIGFLLAIFYGVRQIDNPLMLRLIVHYITATLIMYFIVSVHRKSTRSQIFTAFWAFVTVSAFTASFASSYYGSIKSQVGGGEPRKVELFLNENRGKLVNLLATDDGTPKEIYLLGETSTELFVNLGSESEVVPLRLAKSAVLAVKPATSESTETDENANK